MKLGKVEKQNKYQKGNAVLTEGDEHPATVNFSLIIMLPKTDLTSCLSCYSKIP